MDTGAPKDSLRNAVLSSRQRRNEALRHDAAEAIAAHALAIPALGAARRIAAYLSIPSEPGTAALIDALLASGRQVIVPRALGDRTLEWVAADSPTRLGELGVPEPVGASLGKDALSACEFAFVPALAVDHAGYRLGRGAGYYDRALANFAGITCAVVFSDELIPSVPHEEHDVPVQLALTPDGLFRVQLEP